MRKTPYELWFGHSPSVKYFRIFGSKSYINRDDLRSDEVIFLGFSFKCKSYRCFNYRTKKIVECENLRIYKKF